MKQSIVFAHYKNNELLGFRSDTFGTLTMDQPKIYTYSKNQVETVINNINYTLGEKKQSLGALLQQKNIPTIGMDGNDIGSILEEAEEKIYQQGQDAGAFEVRVVKCIDKVFEKQFDVEKAEWVEDRLGHYPMEELQIWLQHPENHECIETHYFSKVGRLNLQ